MSLLYLLSYVGFLVAAGFVILSLASGLLWISELIEEHSKLAKTVGIRAIYVIIATHIILYFTDGLPFLQTIFSIGCHLVYLQNFSSTWPFIALTSPAFVGSCIGAIVNHFLWFFHFADVSRQARMQAQRHFRRPPVPVAAVKTPSFSEVSTFFGLGVWLVPLFLFLSLSANDNALPVSSSMDGLSSPAAPKSKTSISRVSLFKSIVDQIPFLRKRRSSTETVLVSYTHSAPGTPLSPYYSGSNGLTSTAGHSLSSPHGTLDAPLSPASPGTNSDTGSSRQRVSLRPPPKRSRTSTDESVSGGVGGEAAGVGGGVGVERVKTMPGRSSSLMVERREIEGGGIRRRPFGE